MMQDYRYTQTNPTRSEKSKTPGSFIRNLARQAGSMNFFYIISGSAQVLLGGIVTMVAILNLIQPIWLGAFLSLLGCVVTMLGVYQIYDVFNNRRSVADLARDAVERAIRDRN